MNAITCTGLTKHYKDFSLQDVSFSLPSGTILGLVGENGAGKSTTIKLLMNAARRDGGTVTVLGTDNQSPAFLQTRQDIGVVLDEGAFPTGLNARDIGNILSRIYTGWDAETYAALLTRLNLPDHKKFGDFSRGMKMKLSIAAALSHRAKLLLLDEPTSGLDPMVREEILDLFREFACDEEHSVLLSSHIVSDLEKVCDYIAFLHRGRLLLFEEKDRLLEEYAVLRLAPGQLSELEPAAVAGQRTSAYGTEALVRRSLIPSSFVTQHTSLEDIILFMAKEDTPR